MASPTNTKLLLHERDRLLAGMASFASLLHGSWVERFMAQQDRELLLGTSVAASAFSDNNLGRGLDAIFEAGPSRIVTEVGIRAVREFGLDTSAVSYDTTSTSVWGDFAQCDMDQPPPGSDITHGFSKDNRPDLKQFMTELLCVDRGVPIFGQTLDGNTSDKTANNRILSHISSLMARHGLGNGAFVYVADSPYRSQRPTLNRPEPTTTLYRLAWEVELDGAAVEREREISGCFVLLTNVPMEGAGSMDSPEILKTYKGQYAVESNFAFLKDPLVVNDVLLKKPHRIDALGMIIIIALTVWRLMERSMRTHLQNEGTAIEGWDRKQTSKPTSFMMTTAMVDIIIALLHNRRFFVSTWPATDRLPARHGSNRGSLP